MTNVILPYLQHLKECTTQALYIEAIVSFNWDPKGQTTISDDEIVYVERKLNFIILIRTFTIGTSRPETKFGDKHVVMHPDDKAI